MDNDKTPIEVILQVDNDGTVLASRVYEYLELNPKNYSHWSKKNITGNKFAEENADYISFVLKDERNPKPSTDYKLSINFAKKLCMLSKTERGEQARNYFIKCENKLKELASAASLPRTRRNAKDEGIGEIASLLKVTISAMKTNSAPPHTVMRQIELIYGHFGLPTAEGFATEPPASGQLMLGLVANISQQRNDV